MMPLQFAAQAKGHVPQGPGSMRAGFAAPHHFSEGGRAGCQCLEEAQPTDRPTSTGPTVGPVGGEGVGLGRRREPPAAELLDRWLGSRALLIRLIWSEV